MKFKDLSNIQEKYSIAGSDWMQLKEGENKIRIITEFEDYGVHRDKEKEKNVICVGKEKCIYCQAGDKAKVQFLGKVIDRADGKVKLLRIGYKIFQQLGDLANSSEYGFDGVPPYDVVIKRAGKGLNTIYTVIPGRQDTPLTEEEMEKAINVSEPREVIDRMKAKLSMVSGRTEVEETEEGEEIEEGDMRKLTN